MGATVTSVDASAYSFLVSILVPEIPLPIAEHIFPNLWAYCEPMKKKYYET
jgi:Glutathione S-transferase, C-terminal domain